jgi:hypothetical protein
MASKKKAQPVAETELTPLDPKPNEAAETVVEEVSPDNHSHQGCSVNSAGISLDISDHLN